MSEKSVKITNGKILNYTITAEGYKTINGSKLITADTTITKNMLPISDANGVYSLGDRLGGIASFVCYYNSTNDNKKYAVFVLDAQYRSTGSAWGPFSDTGLPSYSSSFALETMEGCPDSATWTNNYISANYNISDFPAFKWCNDISLLSLGITAKLPNPYEYRQIYLNRVTLDSFDPTLSSYSGRGLTNFGNYKTCYQQGNRTAWLINSAGNISYDGSYKTNPHWVIPIFEVEVQ